MSYDLIVIGTGPGGYVCAIRASQLGLKVAVVEKRATFGGTCLNVGCIPYKALLQSSHLFEEAGHDLAEHGIVLGPPKLDFAQLMKRKGEVKDTLSTKNILIASGSEVTPLPGVTVDEKKIVSSTGALELTEVPKHLVVVGAGIIGLELGSVWRRLGADVTVIEFLDRITPGVDDEITKHFQRALAKQGLTFKLGSKVTKADASGQGVTLTVEPAKGGAAETVEADIVLVCIGRRPFVEGLGLDKAGVKLS